MIQSAPLPSLASQLLTPAKLAWVMDVSDRTVAEWTGGRRRKPQIACFKKGRVIRFAPEAVLQFIFAHTILPTQRVGSQLPKLDPEQFELLWRRVEKLVQACNPSAEQSVPIRQLQPAENGDRIALVT